MAEKKSGILRSAFVYTVGGVAGKAVPFLLLPVLTRYLSPSDYGLVATFQVVLGVTIPFVGLNVTNAMTRNYYDLSRKELSVYIGNCMIVLLVSLVAVYLAFGLLGSWLSSAIVFPFFWLMLVPLVAAGRFLMNSLLSMWRVEHKAFLFSALNIGMTVTNMALSLVLVVAFAQSWQGRLIGIIASTVLFGLIGLVLLIRRGQVSPSPRGEYIKDSLVIGAPLVPHMIGSWTGTMTNRLFLNSMVGLNATGIYSVGYNFGAVQTLVQDAFHQAWIPSLFEKLKKGDHDDKREIVKISYLYFFISLAMAFIVAKLSAVIIPFFVGAEFAEASKYVLWIALGFSADGMGKMVVGYLYFQKKTYWLATISVVSGAIGLPITYILIKQNGPIGAAQSFTIVFFLKFLLTWFASMRVLPMPWALSRLAPDPSAG